MREGHREAQIMFEAIGQALGYRTCRSFSPQLPTDGVWFQKRAFFPFEKAPIVSVEVVVSESPKTIRGSIATLELVSPSLGILLIQTDEIRRGLVRRSKREAEIETHLQRLTRIAEELAERSKQRVEVWHFERLRAYFRSATGRSSLQAVAR